MAEVDFQGGVYSQKKHANRSITAASGSGTPSIQATIHFTSMTMTRRHTISYGETACFNDTVHTRF
jgi:hypothetical protein